MPPDWQFVKPALVAVRLLVYNTVNNAFNGANNQEKTLLVKQTTTTTPTTTPYAPPRAKTLRDSSPIDEDNLTLKTDNNPKLH